MKLNQYLSCVDPARRLPEDSGAWRPTPLQFRMLPVRTRSAQGHRLQRSVAILLSALCHLAVLYACWDSRCFLIVAVMVPATLPAVVVGVLLFAEHRTAVAAVLVLIAQGTACGLGIWICSEFDLHSYRTAIQAIVITAPFVVSALSAFAITLAFAHDGVSGLLQFARPMMLGQMIWLWVIIFPYIGFILVLLMVPPAILGTGCGSVLAAAITRKLARKGLQT